ncbi:sugar transferase [Candidatus Dojkabacteria bacterium]|nr:sugar transferase [Candidatus Dojkabacteria bacterium]
MPKNCKILQIVGTNYALKNLLLPLIKRLISEGNDVHVACSEGESVQEFSKEGFVIQTVNIERKIKPLSNILSLWRLYRIMKNEQYDIVHVHTPLAAALGRLAAWMAGVPIVIYTAHGFYFHENLSRWARYAVIFVEKFLARFTDLLFAQSQEDAVTAVKENIYSSNQVVYIGNGVDINRFYPQSNGARKKLGLLPQDRVVGFVGRMVREKGIIDLVEAMVKVSEEVPDAKLVMVGDALESDRDQKTKHEIKYLLAKNRMTSRVLFTGFRDDVPTIMNAIDVFSLPSYREGMPRSIIEAMASGKPVVATNIRGSREEVVPEITGLLVPVGDKDALAKAITSILSNSERSHHMGIEARKRAEILFDETKVLDRQIRAYNDVIKKKTSISATINQILTKKLGQLFVKRLLDISFSLLGLSVLIIPFFLISIAIKIDSKGPVFFRQERAGKKGRPYRIWKFRTMIDGAIYKGLGFTVAKDDDRITRVGKFLRNTGLDELPQLINILWGEMSLVGPRPALLHHVEQYTDFQKLRLTVKPGLTGPAIINGRNLLSWNQRISLDVDYLSCWSVWADIKIIIKTFWVVLVTREGIYGPDGINDPFTPMKTEKNIEYEVVKVRNYEKKESMSTTSQL